MKIEDLKVGQVYVADAADVTNEDIPPNELVEVTVWWVGDKLVKLRCVYIDRVFFAWIRVEVGQEFHWSLVGEDEEVIESIEKAKGGVKK
jgi:hypothetical protein